MDVADQVASEAAGSSPIRRIVLVGLMGSGKSTVGALLAKELGWPLVDLDEEIERREGRDIPRIFLEEGEEAFRRIEQDTAAQVLGGDEIVIASGGGWPCRPRRIEDLPGGSLSVWLRVSPERVLERVRDQGVRRPLLEVDEPERRIRELLTAREPYYRKARWWVDTELHSPREIVQRLMERLTTDPGRPLRI